MRSILEKKAEVTDMFYFLLVIFMFAIGLLILIFVIPQITDGLRIGGLNNSVQGANAISQLEIVGTSTLNNGFLMLVIGFILSTLITSFFVRTHPIFLFLYIIFLGITLLLSFYLGNVYYNFLENNTYLASAVADAPFINLIMNHIAEICLGTGILSMIVVFSKFSTFGGTQQY